MSAKSTFAIIIFVVCLLAGLLLLGQFLREAQSYEALDYVLYDTAFESAGINETNFRIPGVRGGLRVKGDLILSSSLKLESSNSLDISQYIAPDKDVLHKDYFRLWQLQTPFWLEKNAHSDTVYVYCGADTLYVLLQEVP